MGPHRSGEVPKGWVCVRFNVRQIALYCCLCIVTSGLRVSRAPKLFRVGSGSVSVVHPDPDNEMDRSVNDCHVNGEGRDNGHGQDSC